jgi:hypothetical protein
MTGFFTLSVQSDIRGQDFFGDLRRFESRKSGEFPAIRNQG